MEQCVQVAKVYDNGTAEVFIRRESACSGDCHKCSGCGAAKQTVTVLARNAIGAKAGDRVVVSSDDKQLFSAMLVVYILPLALLLAGYFAGLWLRITPGFTALGGFALGVVLILLYHRYVVKRRPVEFLITAYSED